MSLCTMPRAWRYSRALRSCVGGVGDISGEPALRRRWKSSGEKRFSQWAWRVPLSKRTGTMT